MVFENHALIIANHYNYENPLFRSEFKGNTIELNKSEHYTDDVNVIAIESTLEELFENFPTDSDINYVSGQN